LADYNSQNSPSTFVMFGTETAIWGAAVMRSLFRLPALLLLSVGIAPDAAHQPLPGDHTAIIARS
jgi:hypothetical protein